MRKVHFHAIDTGSVGMMVFYSHNVVISLFSKSWRILPWKKEVALLIPYSKGMKNIYFYSIILPET